MRARVAVARVQAALAAPRVGAGGLAGSRVLLGSEARELALGARPLRDGRRALELRLTVRRAVAARSHHDASGLKGRAALGEKVHEVAVVAHENPDAAEAREGARKLLARVGVEVVGGLVGNEHVRAAPEGHSHLQLLALAKGELVKAPGHVVLYPEGLAELPGSSSVVERKVHEPLRRLVGVLRHIGADKPARDRARVRRDESARDLGQRGLAAAVVAQKRGPSGGEGDGDVVENGLAGRRVGVAHAGEHKLHRYLFSVQKGQALLHIGVSWLRMSSECPRFPCLSPVRWRRHPRCEAHSPLGRCRQYAPGSRAGQGRPAMVS